MRGLRVGILVQALALFASGKTITFEDLSDGAAVGAHYTGMIFTNATVLTAGISLNEFEFPPRSGANVAADVGGPISIRFDNPAQSFAGFFNYRVPITLTAYDNSDVAILQAHSAFSSNLALSGEPGSSPNELLSMFTPLGISRVTISGDPLGSSFAFDDVTVSSVPEPGSSAVLVGLLIAFGIGRLARRHMPG